MNLSQQLYQHSKCASNIEQNRIEFLNIKPYGVVDYRKTSNISRTLEGNKIVDHSDVVGASPVGAAPTTSSFSTKHLASMDSAKTAARQYDHLFQCWDLVRLILET